MVNFKVLQSSIPNVEKELILPNIKEPQKPQCIWSDNKKTNDSKLNNSYDDANSLEDKQSILNETKYNDLSHADEKAVKIGNYWYDFDSSGRCERIYKNQPSKSENGVPNSFTYVTYSDNGEVDKVYRYVDEGNIKSDGTRRCNVYDKDGNLQLYYIESDFNDNQTEHRTEKIYDIGDNLLSIVNYDDKHNECYSEIYENDLLKSQSTTENIYGTNNKLVESRTITNIYNDNETVVTKEISKYDENENPLISESEKYVGEKLSEKSSTMYIYDTDNKPVESRILTYNEDEIITSVEILKYDNKGEFKYSYKYNPEIESLIDEMTRDIGNMTEEKWSEYYNKIQELNIDGYKYILNDDENVNNLYFVIQYMGQQGTFFLEDVAKENKDLADKIIQQVVQNEDIENETQKHYVDDIKADMASHPDDYKKLTVDIQRMMHRAWIDKEDYHGDDEINLNNAIDEKTQQRTTGNCYLLSGIKTIDSDIVGRKALNSIRQNFPNGNVIITCKGNDKTYLITPNELIKSDYLSTGDDDMRVYELAMDRYRRDMAYENSWYPVDGISGSFGDVSQAFFGVDATEQIDIDNLYEEYTNGKIFNFSINEDENDMQAVSMGKNANNEDVEIPTNHQLRIVQIENNVVHYTNPWNDSEIFYISIDELRKVDNLDIEGLDLSKI